ncbi:MAG: prephenate dehydrogenase/arogenate dehydrogenase family protein, partial [Firmicutes bacterium]|nr:prephenate dehydrogenase/arogenate dehydrogenase family protein [Bacillota bacterium]
MNAIEERVWSCVCIVGVGLIGGSLALGLRRSGVVQTVLGVDIDKDALDYAVRQGVVNAAASWDEGIGQADLIVLATPPDVTRRLLTALGRDLAECCSEKIVLDVCGTKVGICSEAERQSLCFVGGHPLAGSERSGVRSAAATLLENAVF